MLYPVFLDHVIWIIGKKRPVIKIVFLPKQTKYQKGMKGYTRELLEVMDIFITLIMVMETQMNNYVQIH